PAAPHTGLEAASAPHPPHADTTRPGGWSGATSRRTVAELAGSVVAPAVRLPAPRHATRVVESSTHRREAEPACHGDWTFAVSRRTVAAAPTVRLPAQRHATGAQRACAQA